MTVEIPGYKIGRTLGKGGMATVYLAVQEIFEREVALKVMSKALAEDESFGQRFFREAKIVSQLVHPNIVTVHDVGVHDGYYYLSMEHLDGGDLKQERHRFTLKQKIQAVLDIAKALEYAGAKGYVHRDIKPENIMFHKSDGRAVLTDFGIARAAETDTSMTQTGTAIGTPHYMSPEQAKGKTVDPRSDLYSLGVVFFLLLAGRVPYDAESAVAIGIKHITEPVPLLPLGMDALQPIVDTLLAKKPESRYQDAQEFIRDLQRIDVDLLQQTINYALENQNPDADRDMPTVTSPSLKDLDAVNVVYDDQAQITDRSSALPWVVGLIIVASLGGWLIYNQKPELVKPWLGSAKQQIEQLWSRMGAAEKTSEPENTNNSQAPSSKSKAVPTHTPEKPQNNAQKALASGKIDRKPESQVTSLNAKNLKKQPSPSAAPQPALPPVTEYQQKITSLRAMYENDQAYLADLVDAHRTLLKVYPDHSATLRSLEKLRAGELNKVEQLMAEDKLISAQKKVTQLKTLFPRARKELAALETRIKTETEIARLLKQGREYLDAGQLTRPSGRNALASYRRVLKIDAKNTTAKQGLQKITDILTSEAKSLYDAGNYQSALNKVNKALSVVSGDSAAKSLQRRINSKISYQREMDDFFRLAELRASQGDFFSPPNDNANYYYQRILQREANNSRAKQGREQLVDDFARTIWQMVGNEEFRSVQEHLRSAIRAMPDNSRLKSLQAAVDEVIAEKRASTP